MSDLNVVGNEKDETQATLTAKDLEMIVNAMLNASGRVAPRAAGNIANKTEHYGLPLPVSNETMAYQDFINEPNEIIDGSMYALQQSIDNLNTTLTQLSNSVGALDTKINGIQATLTEADLPGMKNEISQLDSRVEVLEDDVMSFVAPQPVPFTRGGANAGNMLRSGGLLIFNNSYFVTSETTHSVSNSGTSYAAYGNITKGRTITETYWEFELATVAGNIFNLSQDTKYDFGTIPMMQRNESSSSTSSMTSIYLVAEYNGVNTVLKIANVIPASTLTWMVFYATIPMGIL